MNKFVYFGVAVVLAVAGFWFTSNKSSAPTTTPTPSESVMASSTPEESVSPSVSSEADATSPRPSPTPKASPASTVKEFTLTASSFKFSLTQIKVKKGDTVRLTLKNDQGMHDWKVDEFKAATKQLKAGESETIEFKVDKTGTFEYYCSVGSHRQMGMKGNLIVE